LLKGSIFQLVNELNPLLVHEVATDPIKGVGGVANHTALFQGVADLLDQSFLRVVGIDGNDHREFIFRESGSFVNTHCVCGKQPQSNLRRPISLGMERIGLKARVLWEE
jgi:hypothetical protein